MTRKPHQVERTIELVPNYQPLSIEEEARYYLNKDMAECLADFCQLLRATYAMAGLDIDTMRVERTIELVDDGRLDS
jgi:glycerol-3-phosphate dehydrogenase